MEKLRSRVSLPSTSSTLQRPDMICVTVGKRRKFVELTSVQAVIAAGDYTELLLADASSRLCSRRMRDWETSLPQKDFMRVHRAAIVRVDAVESFEKQGDGGPAPRACPADPRQPSPVAQRSGQFRSKRQGPLGKKFRPRAYPESKPPFWTP